MGSEIHPKGMFQYINFDSLVITNQILWMAIFVIKICRELDHDV